VFVVVAYIGMEYLRVKVSPSGHVAARAARNHELSDNYGIPHMTVMPMIPNRYNLKACRIDWGFSYSMYS
jgi:hypothetical protein